MRRAIRQALDLKRCSDVNASEETLRNTFEDARSGRMFTLTELAELLKCSHETVSRKFKKEPGVVKIGRIYRIPEHVLKAVLRRMTAEPE